MEFEGRKVLYIICEGNRLDNIKANEIRIKNLKVRRRAVECVTDGKVYPSVKEASEATGVPSSNISACCSGRLKSAGGYLWEHADAARN